MNKSSRFCPLGAAVGAVKAFISPSGTQSSHAPNLHRFPQTMLVVPVAKISRLFGPRETQLISLVMTPPRSSQPFQEFPFHALCCTWLSTPFANKSIRLGPQLTAHIGPVRLPPMLTHQVLQLVPSQDLWTQVLSSPSAKRSIRFGPQLTASIPLLNSPPRGPVCHPVSL
ncbi:hypothetical protein F5B17DRAFT_424344 [Nemania serpens]|nr:hypothetical protein F5B17DRAFT_424344 [Nemania serpens]